VVPRERLELLKKRRVLESGGVPSTDRMVLIPMPEATTRAAALLAGQVDFVEAPSPDTIPRLKSSGMNVNQAAVSRITGTISSTSSNRRSTMCGCGAPPIYAMDRKEMVEMLGGIAQPGYAIYTPTSKLYGNRSNTNTNRRKRPNF